MAITDHTHELDIGSNALNRVEVSDLSQKTSDEFWTRLNGAIQAQLEKLAFDVRQLCPDVQSRGFFTPARFIPLNTYWEFRRGSDNEMESIIAGVCYRNNRGRFVLSADISGEESGTIYYETAEYEILPQQTDEIEMRAKQLADDLRMRANEVVANLSKNPD